MTEPKDPFNRLTSLLLAMVTAHVHLIAHLHNKGVLNAEEYASELDDLEQQIRQEKDEEAGANLIRTMAKSLRAAGAKE